ncbi:MAG: hypothetical protein HYZ50_14760 [Deltaproteobacteria bacterium]|nr:hypothetical protein [Deltaproteobacteria bacterium]
MRTRLTLHPHQDGAKQLYAEYGERLLCVRYRCDEQAKKRYKTVELIVEEHPWAPVQTSGDDIPLMPLRVAAKELTVRHQIKSAGGRWVPARQVWELRHDRVIALGLAERIVASAL